MGLNQTSKWTWANFEEAVEIWDSLRKPINSKERAQRVLGKSKDDLYPYYGATGQVGYIDSYLSDGEYVLLGEDGAPFLNPIANKAYLIRGKAWVNNHAHILRSKYNNKFLCYYGFVTGTTRYKLTQAAMKRIPVPVPNPNEQERIVSKIEELFSKLDASVTELETTKEKLKVYRQAVLKEAFTPSKEWKRIKALDIGEVKLGRQRSPKNISNLYPTKYIRAANITEQGIDLSDVLEMEFTPTERSKYYLQENDIVISEASGSPTQVGKPALWKCEIPKCCFQNTVIRHRVTQANPEYVFWYYKYLYMSGYFSSIVGGVGINHLGAKNFSNIEIAIPSAAEQTKIVQKIEQIISVYSSIEQTIDTSLQQAESLRQSILKQAFEGRLV